MNIKKQRGYTGILILVLAALAGLGGWVMIDVEREALEKEEAGVTAYASQFATIQNRALSFYKDNGGTWPSSLEQLNTANSGRYRTGLSTAPSGEEYVLNVTSGWLLIQSNAQDKQLAEQVADLVIGGQANNGVITSTMKNPYEIDAYDDYLQRMENPNDPSRTRLETSIDWNDQEINDAGSVTGDSIEFDHYESTQDRTGDTTINNSTRLGSNVVTASGDTLSVNTGLFRATGDVRATVARLNELDVRNAQADTFEGSDFRTPEGSVNSTYWEIKSLQNDLRECMYVTEWCFPKAPKITQTGCEPRCTIIKASENFSARLRARVSECQHGCKYSWQLGSASGVCRGGSISEGGYQNLSCDISGTVPAKSTRSYAIKLTALNAVDTDKRTSKTIPVSWENTMANTSLEDIASYRIDVYRDSNVGWRIKQETVYPTINGKDYGDWGATDCPRCTWSYTVVEERGRGRFSDGADNTSFGVPGERCEDLSARVDIALVITNPETGESVTQTVQLHAYEDNYHPWDCGG